MQSAKSLQEAEEPGGRASAPESVRLPYYYSDSCRVIDFERFISNKCKEKFRLIKKLTIFFEGLYQVKDYYKKIDINWESLEEEKFIEEVWRST